MNNAIVIDPCFMTLSIRHMIRYHISTYNTCSSSRFLGNSCCSKRWSCLVFYLVFYQSF